MREHRTRFQRQRRYPMSVAEAWQLLADTDHLNRTIGLPPIEFRALADPLLRGAEAKAFGIVPVRWKEFPFEWVRERRYVVRREFETGPMNCIEVGTLSNMSCTRPLIKSICAGPPPRYGT